MSFDFDAVVNRAREVTDEMISNGNYCSNLFERRAHMEFWRDQLELLRAWLKIHKPENQETERSGDSIEQK